MLTVHRAEETGRLVDVLAQTLSTPLPDPMQTEIVAVPERGVERWLRQQLALRLGTDPMMPRWTASQRTSPSTRRDSSCAK